MLHFEENGKAFISVCNKARQLGFIEKSWRKVHLERQISQGNVVELKLKLKRLKKQKYFTES